MLALSKLTQNTKVAREVQNGAEYEGFRHNGFRVAIVPHPTLRPRAKQLFVTVRKGMAVIELEFLVLSAYMRR
jgi:hypothetical protein